MLKCYMKMGKETHNNNKKTTPKQSQTQSTLSYQIAREKRNVKNTDSKPNICWGL